MKRFAFLAVAAAALALSPAVAGTVSIPGLTESGGTIEVQSWSWGTSNAREAGSGMATGKRQYQPLLIRKRIDKSSPLLMKACTSGQVFPLATFNVNGKSLQVSGVKLTNCTTSGDTESISFTYQKIEWER